MQGSLYDALLARLEGGEVAGEDGGPGGGAVPVHEEEEEDEKEGVNVFLNVFNLIYMYIINVCYK